MRRRRPARDGSSRNRECGGWQSIANPIDLGVALSVYSKHEDGSLFELGNPASPLTRHSAAGTWPTEQ
jgi:hypothetical protein